jgi:hypothetical protein
MGDMWRFWKLTGAGLKTGNPRAPTRLLARLRLRRRCRGDYFVFTEQHAVTDIQDERFLSGMIGQGDHAAATLQEPKTSRYQ